MQLVEVYLHLNNQILKYRAITHHVHISSRNMYSNQAYEKKNAMLLISHRQKHNFLFFVISKEWLPGRCCSDSVSPFTFSWTNACKSPPLSLCCLFLSPLHIVLDSCLWWCMILLVRAGFVLLSFTLPRKTVSPLDHIELC